MKKKRIIVLMLTAILIFTFTAQTCAEIKRTVWKYKLPWGIDSMPVKDPDGTLYIGYYKNLYAFRNEPDSRNFIQEHIWKFETEGMITTTPVVGGDGTVYIGSNDGNFYAVSPDGSKKWVYKTTGCIDSSPSIDLEGIVYFGNDQGEVFAVDSAGELCWVYKTAGKIKSSPAVGSGGVVYIGSEDGCLYAINRSGEEVWRFKTGDRIVSSPAIGEDGTIYIASYDHYLYAVNPNGSKKWAFKTGNIIKSSPVIGRDHIVYIGSYDWKLYAITQDGIEKWRFNTYDSISSTPAIGSDGTIYVGNNGNKIYAIDRNGKQISKYFTDQLIVNNPVLDEGHMWITDNERGDGTLYLLEISNKGLEASSWPMFGHDLMNTGRQDVTDNPSNQEEALEWEEFSLSCRFKYPKGREVWVEEGCLVLSPTGDIHEAEKIIFYDFTSELPPDFKEEDFYSYVFNAVFTQIHDSRKEIDIFSPYHYPMAQIHHFDEFMGEPIKQKMIFLYKNACFLGIMFTYDEKKEEFMSQAAEIICESLELEMNY